MGTIAELEHLLERVRFLPPLVLPFGPRPPPLPPSPPKLIVMLLGLAAMGCVIVLLLVFWSTLLRMRP